MPTIRDVARLANVSVATVSRVLNGSSKVSEQSRRAVLEAQKELSFCLNANARALAHQDSEIIGATVPDLYDPYFGALIRSCERTAQLQGFTLLVLQTFHDVERERRAIDTLLSHQCRGLIIHALTLPEDELADYMRRVPFMVLINRTLKGFEERCVGIDDLKGEYLVVKELLSQGHRDIAFVGSNHRIHDAFDRHAGYVKALKEAGITPDPHLLINVEPYMEGGAEAARELLARKVPFTAVACYNDYMAAGFMAELGEAGYRVPDDISVTGFDDLFLASCLTPKLTTVHHPVDEMGKEAVLLSTSLYNHDEEPYKLTNFDVSVVRRKSVGPVRQG